MPVGYADMRKGLNSLVPFVQQNFGIEPYSSSPFDTSIRPAEALNNQGRRFSYPMQDQRSIEGADLLIPPICQRKSFLRDGR